MIYEALLLSNTRWRSWNGKGVLRVGQKHSTLSWSDEGPDGMGIVLVGSRGTHAVNPSCPTYGNPA